MASRVPAWKRLGLKLKSEPEAPKEVEREEPTYDAVEPVIKRKRSPEPEVTEKKSKKAKKSKTSAPAANESPRKSVAFTEDTKTEDGDSIKQLFGAWVQEQKKNDPTFVSVKDKKPAFTTPEPSKVSETVDTNLPEAERRVQRVTPAQTVLKKAKPAKKPKVQKGVKPKPFEPALLYLKTFHEDKANWKFNKISQTLILKHAFDIDQISPEYNDALDSYISGLKGLARVHLRERALEIRDKDAEDGIEGFPETMDDRERAQENYERAMKEWVDSGVLTSTRPSSRIGYEEGIAAGFDPETHPAFKARMEKRKRSERILNILASTPGDPEDLALPPVKKQATPELVEPTITGPAKKVRNRKKRTTEYNSDSSSSSDSSDDEDEEEKPKLDSNGEVIIKPIVNNDSDSGSSNEGDGLRRAFKNTLAGADSDSSDNESKSGSKKATTVGATSASENSDASTSDSDSNASSKSGSSSASNSDSESESDSGSSSASASVSASASGSDSDDSDSD